MVGVCGVIGSSAPTPERMVDGIVWSDREQQLRYGSDTVSLSFSFHPSFARGQPAEPRRGDVRIWVWGDVYGHGPEGAYSPRPPTVPSAQYCARLFDQFGTDFVTDLNGDFLIVIQDQRAGTIMLLTDRLGTRPIYYARIGDAIVLSSNLQTLPYHTQVPARFDPSLLDQYLRMRRVLGIETPLEGVREFSPGAIVTIDMADRSHTAETYWRPRHDPEDRPLSYFVDELTETIQQVLAEWTTDARRYGVLLSGGSDSRLVEAAIDRPVTAFHIADWDSREARIARRSARTAGDEFVMLRRDESYYREMLNRVPEVSAFSGWFDQGYVVGFEEEIVERVDTLLTGLYADMLFGANGVRTSALSLGNVGTLSIPLHREIETVDEYIEFVTETAPPTGVHETGERSLVEGVREHIHSEGRQVVSHGVRYNSLGDLVMYGDFYPLSADTDAIFSRSLVQLCPARTPFLDKRLLALQQRIPMRYLLRRNLVNRALTRLAPDLAEIPHARTGIPPKYPFPIEYVGGNLNGFRRKHVFEETPPQSHLDHGPWPNRTELIRRNDFVFDAIRRDESIIRAIPGLDYSRIVETYRAHQEGEDNLPVLYSLVTWLGMPVTRQVYGDRCVVPNQEATANGESASQPRRAEDD